MNPEPMPEGCQAIARRRSRSGMGFGFRLRRPRNGGKGWDFYGAWGRSAENAAKSKQRPGNNARETTQVVLKECRRRETKQWKRNSRT